MQILEDRLNHRSYQLNKKSKQLKFDLFLFKKDWISSIVCLQKWRELFETTILNSKTHHNNYNSLSPVNKSYRHTHWYYGSGTCGAPIMIIGYRTCDKEIL